MDKATEEFITAAKNIHGDTYDYSKTAYKGVHSKVLIPCPKHGDFEQIANTHKRGGTFLVFSLVLGVLTDISQALNKGAESN